MSKRLPKRAYGYVRVSTEEQADKGISLRLQRSKIRELAKLRDLRLVKIYADEGISGRSLERPGFQALLEQVRSTERETIVVYKLTRLSRRTRDLLFLVEDVFLKGNTRLVSVSEQIDTDTPMGKFFLTIMGALAQMEREIIAQRTKETMRFKKERGERLGSPPYGFRLNRDKKMVQNPKEMRVVRRILKWRKEGWSYADIAEELNRKKVKTKRGKKWHASTVRYIAKNPRYAKK